MTDLQKKSKIKAIQWVLLWCLSFTFAMSCAKFLSREVSDVVLLFMRSLFGLVFIMPFIMNQGLKPLKTKVLPLHLLRVFFSCVATACTYYAYRNLPLAFATSIGFTAPLFITVLAMLFLGDRVSPKLWAAIFVGYIGILLMLRPTEFVFDTNVFVALMANLVAGCALIAIKKLTRTESTETIMMFTGIGAVVVSGIASLFYWQTPSLQDTVILCGVGGFGTLSQFCYVKALQNGDPSFISPFQYLRLVVAIPVGILLFFETPGIWELLGSCVIIASTAFIAYEEKRKKQADLQEDRREAA